VLAFCLFLPSLYKYTFQSSFDMSITPASCSLCPWSLYGILQLPLPCYCCFSCW
jgi:hypothetical protein